MTRRITSFILVLFTMGLCYAQTHNVKGTVLSIEDSMPLIGVNVIVKGSSAGATTDFDGNFTLRNVPSNGTLVFSYLGYKTIEVQINNQTTLSVKMEEDTSQLDEVVVVGYGTQKKTTLTASVATVKGEAIQAVPVANASNALSGRLPGLLTRQGSGEPGYDDSTLRIRGIGTIGNSSALIIIDGIERPLSSINTRDIADVSILKDAASVAPYGLKGANGVVLITTKRGKSGKSVINYESTVGWQSPTALPDMLSSFEWASLKNIAAENDGVALPFSQDDLNSFQSGADQNRYPNENVVDRLINSALMTTHNLSASGGTDKVKYYGSIGFLEQESNWGKATNFKRYNFKSNVDFQVTDNTKFSFDIAGQFRDAKYPGSGSASHILFGFWRLNPTNPIFYNNDKNLPAGYFERNPYLDINKSGYTKEDRYDLQLTAKLEQKITAIPGLTLKANLSVDKMDNSWKAWKLPYTFYQINNDDTFSGFTGNTQAPSLRENYSFRRQITTQLMAQYNNSWGNHKVDGVLVFEPRVGVNRGFGAFRDNYELEIDELSLGSADPADSGNSGGSSEDKQVGYAYRVTYDFSGKYILEAGGRYDGHYYFAPGSRFAFFPSFSAAWRLSDENFFNSKTINNLKVRASWGKSGNLAGGPNQFLTSFGVGGLSYVFGGGAASSIFESGEANPNITWEKAVKTNIGIEAGFFNGALNLEIDGFYEKRADMLIFPNAEVPLEYGIGIAQENSGEMENKGFDFKLSTVKRFNEDLKLTAALNFTYAKNKILFVEENEVTRNDPERSRTGRPLGTRFGLQAQGYFQTQAEVDATPYAAALGLQPGDVKYWDRNEDGQLNSDDHVVIGRPDFPEIIYGLDLGLNYKQFYLNTLWQGAGNASTYQSGWAAQPFNQSNGVAFKHHLDYWTPDNPDAEYPRIVSNPTGYNYWGSSHWVRDASYLRLKTLTIGYQFSLPEIGLQNVNVYGTGQNLLTFSKLRADQDPENPSTTDYYWQQKVLTFGINLTF